MKKKSLLMPSPLFHMTNGRKLITVYEVELTELEFLMDEDQLLNQEEIEIIVREIFDSLHIERPYSVDFELDPAEIYSKPSASIKKDTIIVRAASIVEARKVIGQQAVEKKWSWYKWMLASKIWTSVLIASVIYLAIFLSGFSVRVMLPVTLWILNDILTVLLLLIPLYLMVKMPVWSENYRRELQDILMDFNGIPDYDAEYQYIGYSVLIGFGYLTMYLAVSFTMLATSTSESDLATLLLLTMAFSAIPSLVIPLMLDSRNTKKFDRCTVHEETSIFNEEEPQGMNTPEALELAKTALELARKLELEGFTNPDNGTPLSIEVAYHEIPYSMCKNCDYAFEEERVLFDIRDTTLESAKRSLASVLVGREIMIKRSLKYPLGNIMMGILSPLILILLGIFIGVYAVVAAIIGLVLFVMVSNRSAEIDSVWREYAHTSLKKTELYSPRLLTIYSYLTFALDEGFELKFKVGGIVFYVLLVILMLIFG